MLGPGVTSADGPSLENCVGILDTATLGTRVEGTPDGLRVGSLVANETLGRVEAVSTVPLVGLIETIPDCDADGNGENTGCSPMLRDGIVERDSTGKFADGSPDTSAGADGFALGGVVTSLAEDRLGPFDGFPSSMRSTVGRLGSDDGILLAPRAGEKDGGIVSYSRDAIKPGTAGITTSTSFSK
jgi:hypothetical protein